MLIMRTEVKSVSDFEFPIERTVSVPRVMGSTVCVQKTNSR